MKDARALYLVAPPGAWRDRASTEAGTDPGRVLDGADALLPLDARDPGVVVLHPAELPPGEVVRILEACAQAGPSWIPALVTKDGDGFEAVTLGPGYRHPLEELARLSAGVEGAFLLTLPDVLERVRVARHDINNPLAAAMAEAQLLRMDAEGEELIEALDAIQAQLRRIRDLVSSLHAIRPPSRAPAPPSTPA